MVTASDLPMMGPCPPLALPLLLSPRREDGPTSQVAHYSREAQDAAWAAYLAGVQHRDNSQGGIHQRCSAVPRRARLSEAAEQYQYRRSMDANVLRGNHQHSCSANADSNACAVNRARNCTGHSNATAGGTTTQTEMTAAASSSTTHDTDSARLQSRMRELQRQIVSERRLICRTETTK